MTSKIIKINKDTLAEMGEEDLYVSDVNGLIIPHVFDSNVSDNFQLEFTLDIAKGHAPYIKDAEFMVAFREKVDATSRGPSSVKITNAGDDKGKENYKESAPHVPWELPQGFIELKDED